VAPESHVSAGPNKRPSAAGCCGRARHPVRHGRTDGTRDRSLFERQLSSPPRHAARARFRSASCLGVTYRPLSTPLRGVISPVNYHKRSSGGRARAETEMFIQRRDERKPELKPAEFARNLSSRVSSPSSFSLFVSLSGPWAFRSPKINARINKRTGNNKRNSSSSCSSLVDAARERKCRSTEAMGVCREFL